jgi:uncharacterized protein (TIGR00369 family)
VGQVKKMPMAVTEEEIRTLIGGANFVTYYNFQFHSIAKGTATILVPYRKEFERPGGVIAGPVYMAAADFAMWLAIATYTGVKETDSTVTIEMKTNFLSGARQEDFLCTAKVLKLGRRVVYGTADCSNAEGKIFTHHTLTYIRPEK